MSNPRYFSAGQAAKEAGVSKTTISNALRSGRLSYVEKNGAGYRIDPAELFRVFPLVNPEPVKVNNAEPPPERPGDAVQMAKLEAERDALRREVADLRRNLDRAEENADQWRDQAQRLALTHERRGGWFDWLRRRD